MARYQVRAAVGQPGRYYIIDTLTMRHGDRVDLATIIKAMAQLSMLLKVRP